MHTCKRHSDYKCANRNYKAKWCKTKQFFIVDVTLSCMNSELGLHTARPSDPPYTCIRVRSWAVLQPKCFTVLLSLSGECRDRTAFKYATAAFFQIGYIPTHIFMIISASLNLSSWNSLFNNLIMMLEHTYSLSALLPICCTSVALWFNYFRYRSKHNCIGRFKTQRTADITLRSHK